MEYLSSFIMSSCYSTEGRDVEEIVSRLNEVEDWKELACWLDIERATINNININCAPHELVQCTWRELVQTYCDMNAAGDPDRTAADIAVVLDHKMHKKKQAQDLKQLKFTSEFDCDYHSANMML